MAVVVQSYTVDKSFSGASLTIPKPAGVVSGDLLLLLCSNDSIADTDQFNAVSGWTKEFEIGDSTADTHMALYSRTADGTEGASFTVTMAVSEYALSWCLRIDGHDATTPINVIGTETIVANGSSITCPAVTTTKDGCLAIAWATEGNGNAHPYTVNSGTGWPSTIPGDETGDTDQEFASSASQAGVFLTKTIATAGSSNQIIFDISGATSYGKCGIQFAVQPALAAGEMSTIITGSSTVGVILGATIPFSSNIAIQNSTPFGGTPVYAELATKIGYLSSFTQSVTVPVGDNRMVILAHAHWDSERIDADGSATYDGNAMTPLRTASTSMTMYYYLLGDGVEETKDIVWTAGADGNQFQTNIMSVITEIQQTTPIIYHDSDRADPHISPFEHSLTVTAHKDYVILTFESNSASSATFLKASSSDDFIIKRTHFGSLSSSGLGYKEYTAATANQSYIWDTLSSSFPTQNVNQFEIAEGGTIDMVAIIIDGDIVVRLDGKLIITSGVAADTNLLDGLLVLKSAATNLLDGKMIVSFIAAVTDLLDGLVKVKNADTNLLDGKAVVKDTTTDLVDGRVMVKDVNTNLLDGKVVLKDIATNLLDGLVVVKDTATDLADGRIMVKNNAIDLVDGRVVVSNAVIALLDGRVHIKDSTIALLDGLIKMKDEASGLYDGKVMVKGATTNLLDGRVDVLFSAAATNLLDGRIQVLNKVVVLLDGKVMVKDTTIDLLDGKINVENVATELLDGKVHVSLSSTGLIDGKMVLLDGATDLLDGKIFLDDGSVRLDDSDIEDIVSYVWDEMRADHKNVQTFGRKTGKIVKFFQWFTDRR